MKNNFIINETISEYDKTIISYDIHIKNNKNHRMKASYNFKKNIPISAKLHWITEYDEISEGLIKNLLEYSYSKINTIPLFEFNDTSHIETIDRHTGLVDARLKLSYYSIVYTGKTWFERYFNASMINKRRYADYRSRVEFLTDKHAKESFEQFLQIIQPPLEQIEALEEYYKEAKTYREFFENIPCCMRYKILSPWLNNFMRYYIGDIYTMYGWEIDIRNINLDEEGTELYLEDCRIIHDVDIHLV